MYGCVIRAWGVLKDFTTGNRLTQFAQQPDGQGNHPLCEVLRLRQRCLFLPKRIFELPGAAGAKSAQCGLNSVQMQCLPLRRQVYRYFQLHMGRAVIKVRLATSEQSKSGDFYCGQQYWLQTVQGSSPEAQAVILTHQMHPMGGVFNIVEALAESAKVWMPVWRRVHPVHYSIRYSMRQVDL